MIKRRFKLFAVLFILFSFITLSSCSSNKVNNSEKVDENATEKQKYVVELNMDNYDKYIEIRSEGGGSRFCFYGALSYAFYENVTISYVCSYNTSEAYFVDLSAGGYGLYYEKTLENKYYTYSVVNAWGRVIYWI